MRQLVAVTLVAALAGCTVALLRTPVSSIDDYAAARVRVYRLGLRLCRAEIITATETIQIGPAWCAVLPQTNR
jgi:hypothetical protein